MRTLIWILSAGLLTVLVSGCGLGAASMRVEVEVYKGPLSKEPDIQFAELHGLLTEADAIVFNATETACALMHGFADAPEIFFEGCEIGAIGNAAKLELVKANIKTYSRPWKDRKDCKDCETLAKRLEARSEAWREYIEEFEKGRSLNKIPFNRSIIEFCNSKLGSSKYQEIDSFRMVAQIQDDAIRLRTRLAEVEQAMADALKIPLKRNISDKKHGLPAHRKALHEISKFAMELKTNAEYWGGYILGVGNPQDRAIRIVLAGFANLTSEFSNQFGSRADALLKQIEGDQREFLPPSVYLRDAQVTDFANLPAWKRAATAALWPDRLKHPFNSLKEDEISDRVRVYERLYADNYWSNVNTVYASGAGDVAMAFVKDDIGNWNLKQFDNDPSKLLDAYKAAGLAIVNRIASLATSGTSQIAGQLAANVSNASKLVDLADRLSTGRSGGGTAASGVNVNGLHQRSVARLKAVSDKVNARVGERDLKQTLSDAEALNAAKNEKDSSVCVLNDDKSDREKKFAAKRDAAVERAWPIQQQLKSTDIETWQPAPKALAQEVKAIVAPIDPNQKMVSKTPEEFIEECDGLTKKGLDAKSADAKWKYAINLEDWLTVFPTQTKSELEKILDEHNATLDAVTEIVVQPADTSAPPPPTEKASQKPANLGDILSTAKTGASKAK